MKNPTNSTSDIANDESADEEAPHTSNESKTIYTISESISSILRYKPLIVCSEFNAQILMWGSTNIKEEMIPFSNLL